MAFKKRLKKLPNLRPKNKRSHKKPGAAPGTIEHIGEQHMDQIKIMVHDYNESQLEKISVDQIQNVKPYLENPTNTWIKVHGLHDTEKLKSIWDFFDLHPLIQEDIVNTTQRPKIEIYDNCIFFVLRMLKYSSDEQKIKSEQISLVLGKNYVISFQETDSDYFKPILDRLSIKESRIRNHGADYLTYALIDTIVDYYFAVINNLADNIEQIEEALLLNPEDEPLGEIHKTRREIIFFRKSVWPLRDAINTAIRDESGFIASETKIYLRDVYDHMIQVIDGIENYRDTVLGLHDMYMSHVSNKMNEVMKVLTIIATIFIPLTFIAGLYGMNFNTEKSPYNMPELNWFYGYPISLAIMAIIAIIMVVYFKRKNWM